MEPGKILVAECDGVYILKLVGDVRVVLCPTMDTFFAAMFDKPEFQSVLIDLTETLGIDSTSLGLLAKLALYSKERYDIVPTIISTNDNITRILDSMGFDQVFIIVKEVKSDGMEMGELPVVEEGEQQVKQKVIDAHKVLMELNAKNRESFKDLVKMLEQQA